MRNFKIVGLTGPTGSGKSSLAAYLVKKGFVLIDADLLARKVLEPGSVCLKTLVSAFGNEILNTDRSLNRKKLAASAFSSQENTQLLNDITHPFVYLQALKDIKSFLAKGHKYILYDAPLLLESNGDVMCDYVLAVVCPKEERINRIMRRDGLSRAAALQRIQRQQPDLFYTQNADFTVHNIMDLHHLYQETDRFLKQFHFQKDGGGLF